MRSLPDLSIVTSELGPRLLLRGVRIEIAAIESSERRILFRVLVPDRDTGKPRPFEFNVELPASPEDVDPELVLATNIQQACAAFVAHELAECILNRAGLPVIDPHRRGPGGE